MKKSCLIIGTLLWGMSAFAQTTIWKRSGWECRISDKGTLEQIVFKGSQRNDTVPFFHDKSNMIQKHLEECGFEDVGGDFTYIPNDLKDVTPEQRETLDKMIERLEEFDDVQTVYTNMKPEGGEEE